MIKGIPWEIVGPALSAVIIILAVVFGFILKLKKLEKPVLTPPKNINSTGKKTLCFTHHGNIAANQTAIKMIGEQLKISNENNRKDHGKIFDKIDLVKKEIIQAIDENSVKE